MDKQEIIEGNKIIAGFMGWTFEIIPDEYGGELIAYYEGKSRWRGERPDYLDQMMSSEHGYAFHCDWNKLMPVVEKIKKLPMKKGFVMIHMNKWEQIVEGLMNLDMNRIWIESVEFIKWFNSQKQ